jgi:excisionase family DNA binding protein
MPEPLLLTVPQVMDRLQVGKHAVYQLIRTQRLGSVCIGRSRRIPTTALHTYLESITGEVR